MVRTFLPQPTREDAQVLLAKRFFIVGCFGLPWLWAVNCLYFWPKTFGRKRDTGTTPTSSTTATRRSSAAAQAELRKWVGRSLVGAVVGFAALAIWILVLQLGWKKWGKGVVPWMIHTPESYSTGW